MGISGRKYVLPAPTESLIDSNVDEAGIVSEDIATDLSRRTDRTSATIPDDGSPVTITTAHKKRVASGSKPANTSQTSLLIEFYEGADKTRRPSLRVRMRPSSKTGEVKDGHIVVSQQGSRKASYTKRIPLTANSLRRHGDQEETVGLDEIDTHPVSRAAPIDIEIGSRGSDLSDRSRSPEARYIVPESDISSMPPDSMLGAARPELNVYPAAASSIMTQSDMPRSMVSDMPDSRSDLKPPIIPAERNLSHERITQKAIEKLSSKDRVSSKSGRRHGDKSHGRTSSEVIASSSRNRRHKSSKYHGEESSLSTGTDPSQISNSLVSAGAKSVGSGTSNITNPKLLQTVEDAIRRLILPELIEIKRNGSRRQTSKDDDYSDISESSIAREKEQSRWVSSGSKSRRRSSREHGSGSRRRHRDYDDDSMSDISSPRKESTSSTGDAHRQNRSVAAGAMAGTALTAAALHHQDSTSTVDRDRERRRRRKRSKSRSSRSTSMNESEEIFDAHDVPPMPFVSEIGSELTRSSLLSSNTASTATPTQRDVREVIRGSPLAAHPPGLQTPTRNSGDLRQTLGLHHKNISGHDVGAAKDVHPEHPDSPASPEGEYTPDTVRELPYMGSPFLADPERMKQYEQNLHHQHPIRRGLSPIQSVASYATTDHNRQSVMHAPSLDSIASMKRRQQALKEEVSIDSFSSASPDLKKQARPQGINLENRSEIMHQHTQDPQERSRDMDDEYDDEDDDDGYSYDDGHRDSYATNEDPRIDVRHLTNYTDDSVDAPIFDKTTTRQQVSDGLAARPEYVSTPPGVESAVASLVEQSVLELPQSPDYSVHDSVHSKASMHSAVGGLVAAKSGSPLKGYVTIQHPDHPGKARQIDSSPPQSPARSFEEHKDDIIHSTAAEQKVTDSPESEITTNPSVIQGPIGGLTTSNRDHWPYAPTPDRTIPNFPAQQALNRDLVMHAPDLVPEALNVSQRNTYAPKPDLYTGGVTISTPPGIKDEGYATGDTGNHRSPGPFAAKNERAFTPDDMVLDDDPFLAKRNKYTSGLSQGMSPLYDAATGRGIDRIQSKDIVALMDHLTVRDAQRNARDTEILVTLVRSAAEMRNQFEDMKKFITEQDELLMGAGERQHEKTQKVIGGPRPPPPPATRSVQPSTASQDDLPTRRRNIFMRAVQRLGSKNESELQNIEQMLVRLLSDVEELRRSQGTQQELSQTPQSQRLRSVSLNSAENTRTLTDPGYEPEGQAGTSSTGDRSGLLSGTSSRQADYRAASGRKDVVNRVSTVMEGDEEYGDSDEDDVEDENETPRASPAAEARYRQPQTAQVSMQTPPKMHDRQVHDNAPQYTYEPGSAGRKHKSIASSFFGKGGLMSRWSKTTASTMPDQRQSAQKPRPYSTVSRSGSDLGGYQYEPQPEDQLSPLPGQGDDEYLAQEDRPPSPLVPSQVSENPKYQGYRNSQNLQHPQPRQGPTGRYQYHLESEAIAYHDQFSPTSQTSSHWDTQPAVAPANDIHQYAPQPPLSPISDAGYSESSTRSLRRGPPRPPKVLDNDPLVPQRSQLGTMNPSTYVEHVAAARAGSPAYSKSPVAALRSPQGSQTQRKPSGPRPLSSSGQHTTNSRLVKGDLNTVKRTRFRGSPYQIDSAEDLHRA